MTTPIFLFGRLRDRALLSLVLAREVDLGDLEPADAEGHATFEPEGDDGPVLLSAPGHEAEGVLLRFPRETDIARLTFFAGAGAALAPITVITTGGAVEARHFRRGGGPATSGEGWDFAAWTRERRAVAIETAREYMDYFGRMPVDRAGVLRREIRNRALQRVRALAAQPVLGGLRTAFGPSDFEQLALERSYTGFLAVQALRLRHRLFDGGWSGEVERTVVVWGDAVSVLPYDARRDQVLLIEQFRPAPAARGDRNPWCIEVIAGRLDTDETPGETVRREAMEEAGVALGRIERITGFYPTPGVAGEHITSFVGEADLAGAGGSHGLGHEHEDIRTIVLGFDAAMEALEAGAVNTGIALVSLLWLAAHRDRLRAVWGG
jgi:nudix-type nucleoside diphosphatase (YffH/AdpP family)